jgi:hypothetical protein
LLDLIRWSRICTIYRRKSKTWIYIASTPEKRFKDISEKRFRNDTPKKRSKDEDIMNLFQDDDE